jgi:hypothetical protein
MFARGYCIIALPVNHFSTPEGTVIRLIFLFCKTNYFDNGVCPKSTKKSKHPAAEKGMSRLHTN